MSDRYEREIEDILKRAGDFGEPSPPKRASGREYSFRKLVWVYIRQSLGGRMWSFSPGRVMLIGFVLLLSTLIVRPFAAGAIGYLAWAGLLLCIVGYGLILARPPKMDKRWRGQPLDDSSPSERGAIREWLKRRFSRR